MNIDEIVLASKWGLNKISDSLFKGNICNNTVEVQVVYKQPSLNSRFYPKDPIHSGYILKINDERYRPDKETLLLREVDNKLKELKS